ncbi:putative MFS transporter, AGZA family, xanthine/uracil permease [Carnobacterium alterfunditum]|uniref:Putative MFS transporter, AGZA family, xanthine/uracil permease n=1 Tax=Carnobacterium alterfunditum TaxID=28230 RepID=A0A1N6HTV5_9LACT|nr:NCS2 family permease [Carnobacterium alterfunditum]SIO23201.1 putative MFS transporter, AGZA family, xanthine/uracil permease [Carnobacterium alterfunditum]
MNFFKLKEKQTSIKQEMIAGATSFFALSYIIVVNPLILADAGIPAELSVFSTIIISAIGSIMMGLWGKAPIVLVPGMGINAFFTYTIVDSLGLSWQQALAVIFVSGVIFTGIAYTSISKLLADAIPESLKHGITAGIGLFLVVIGLENGGILVDGGDSSFIALGDLSQPLVLLAVIGILLSGVLYLRNVPGSFFIGIVVITIISLITRVHEVSASSFSLSNLSEFPALIGDFDFSTLFSVPFLLAVFSLTMILIFEAIGLFEGMLEDKTRFKSAFKVSGIMTMVSALFGTSPTVAAAESASGIKAGGKTGLTAVTAGVLFLLSLLFTPLLSYIPNAALAPVIVITGAIMMENLKHIPFDDFSEWFPAFLILVMIPLTSSIVDGLAFGFVAYPIFKLAKGEFFKVKKAMHVVSFLFLLTMIAITII